MTEKHMSFIGPKTCLKVHYCPQLGGCSAEGELWDTLTSEYLMILGKLFLSDVLCVVFFQHGAHYLPQVCVVSLQC